MFSIKATPVNATRHVSEVFVENEFVDNGKAFPKYPITNITENKVKM